MYFLFTVQYIVSSLPDFSVVDFVVDFFVSFVGVGRCILQSITGEGRGSLS